MKTQKTMLAAFLTLTSLFAVSNANAQAPAAEPASPFKITADVVSSYVWRGVTSSNTPNFQPTFAVVKGGLEVGVWGSTDFIGYYKEADIYAAYTAGPLKLTVTDYDWNFIPTSTMPVAPKYFDYKSATTGHIFEGTVGYTGPESMPISITANVMFAGADKKATDPTKQAYSTYVELGYAFKYFTPFLGITPSDGYYGDSYGGYTGFAVANLGLSATKNLKITDAYSLPLKATLGFNPQKEDAYLVFGITF
jgi:hypothetical protein